MAGITDEQKQQLMEAAKNVSKNSYSPYSHFAVGAAVLTNDGQIYTGTNVENASYGVTICAERFALGGAVAAGKKVFTAIAVYSPNAEVTPCGVCRQFINEFGDDIEVLYFKNGSIVSQTIKQLLPAAFTKTGHE